MKSRQTVAFEKILSGARNKEISKESVQTAKVLTFRKMDLTTKSMVNKSTQVKNIALGHVKTKIIDSINTWIESQPDFDHAENEKEAYFDLINELYDELKLSMQSEQLKILKMKQIELEYKVVLTLMMVSTYLELAEFRGFARHFQYLAKKTVSLIFSLGSGLDLSPNSNLNFQPTWKSWNNVVDAINEGLKAERMTIENFEKIQDLIPKTEQVILDKKLSIVKRIQNIIDLFKDTTEPNDIYAIDKKLNKRSK